MLFLLANTAIAQDCRYLTNKVSGMDGTRLVITQPMSVSNNFNEGTLEVWSTLRGDTSVIIALVVTNKLQLHVNKTDSIVFTLESGESVFIPVLQDASSITGEWNKLTIMTLISTDQIFKLETTPVKNISITVNSLKMEGEPGNKKQAASIQKAIGCVKQYLAQIPD